MMANVRLRDTSRSIVIGRTRWVLKTASSAWGQRGQTMVLPRRWHPQGPSSNGKFDPGKRGGFDACIDTPVRTPAAARWRSDRPRRNCEERPVLERADYSKRRRGDD